MRIAYFKHVHQENELYKMSRIVFIKFQKSYVHVGIKSVCVIYMKQAEICQYCFYCVVFASVYTVAEHSW